MRIVQPIRVSHTYRQRLDAAPERVFPLLCPVRECEWVEGWAPELVASRSGIAERDCVFTTPANPADAIWYITRHEPERLLVEMLKITPGVTACRIEIQLLPEDTHCLADVTYTHTSLGPEGDAFVAGFTEAAYRDFMQRWEGALNRFLASGAPASG